jgi:geranylgeranyl pyrophosphate synthase
MVKSALIQVNFLTPIQERLQQVEEVMHSQADRHHPELAAAIDHLLSSGGKRIRPAVALLTGAMLGGDSLRLVTLGAAIELLHTATLVHDDLIDGALLRRGIVTLNAQWTPAATVLTGDFIFAQAAKLAAETDSVPVMRIFAETLATIVNGEITQLFRNRRVVNREEYLKRIYSKTASMFELATAASALLSPVSQVVVEEVRRFGYDIGMAFQIVDDVLDFTGEQATMGKPVASDLRQGLITLPAIYYIQSNPHDADVNWFLEGNLFSDERMDRLVNAIRSSGAIEKALDDSRNYVDSALQKLSRQPQCEERRALEELSNYIVRRSM